MNATLRHNVGSKPVQLITDVTAETLLAACGA